MGPPRMSLRNEGVVVYTIAFSHQSDFKHSDVDAATTVGLLTAHEDRASVRVLSGVCCSTVIAIAIEHYCLPRHCENLNLLGKSWRQVTRASRRWRPKRAHVSVQ
eukprot:SAG31_NODE_427_length_15813_cov_13.679649_6_plen_105_part_00